MTLYHSRPIQSSVRLIGVMPYALAASTLLSNPQNLLHLDLDNLQQSGIVPETPTNKAPRSIVKRPTRLRISGKPSTSYTATTMTRMPLKSSLCITNTSVISRRDAQAPPPPSSHGIAKSAECVTTSPQALQQPNANFLPHPAPCRTCSPL